MYCGMNMKKISNNKYRNNNYSNQIYSLNYKFDSTSPAGKFNGTALDLIKKYNELAKDSQSNNDYVGAEVYRQYAEHYRKIVTDINEKKMQRNLMLRDMERNENALNGESSAESVVNENPVTVENLVSDVSDNNEAPSTPEKAEKKQFKIIEIKENALQPAENGEEAAQPKKRVYRRRTTAVSAG